MSLRVPHTRPPVWPERPAGRFAAGVRLDRPTGCTVALLGLPDDTGVRMNGGRPGAAGGPAALRAALARYGTATPAGFSWPLVFDAGDVQPDADLAVTHARVEEASAALAAAGLVPVGVGGGHDLTLPLVRGVLAHHAPMAGVYFDAHLDVRERPGSGMAFRGLLQDERVTGLAVYGLDPFVNDAEHTAWFRAHRGRIAPPGAAMRPSTANWPPGAMFVSVCLDVLDAAAAPGVSAPNPVGMPGAALADWVQLAGRHAGVRCFDLMELCPAHDEGGRTARLAAHLFLAFLRGITERTSGSAD